MSSIKVPLARACAYAAPVFIGAALFDIWAGAYGLALLLVVITVVLMEMRVRMGFRLPRGWLFYIHITSGVLLLLALAGLWHRGETGYRPELLLLFAVMVITGGTLLARNLAAHG